ncbi:MAG TPA: hypothetical protein VLO11_02660 [Luteolibacter sp.]|nr:hypothetical protein [Luteolibacter sp.]
MPLLTVAAHYDGSRALLDEAVQLRPNTRLIVTVLEDSDQERDEFLGMASRALDAACADDEVEYSEADLRP